MTIPPRRTKVAINSWRVAEERYGCAMCRDPCAADDVAAGRWGGGVGAALQTVAAYLLVLLTTSSCLNFCKMIYSLERVAELFGGILLQYGLCLLHMFQQL